MLQQNYLMQNLERSEVNLEGDEKLIFFLFRLSILFA